MKVWIPVHNMIAALPKILDSRPSSKSPGLVRIVGFYPGQSNCAQVLFDVSWCTLISLNDGVVARLKCTPHSR